MGFRGMQARLVLVVLLCAGPCVAQSLSRAERPDVKVGDSWVYQDRDVRTGEKRDTSYVVAAVEADRIVMDTGLSTSGAWTFTREVNFIRRKTGAATAQEAKPYWPAFRFPLEVGKTWDMPFENDVETPTGTRHAKWRWKARVATAEAITVPAGTFQTLRVEAEGTFASQINRRSWTGSHTDTFWFSPDAKRYVKRVFDQSVPANGTEDHHVIELVSYKLVP